MFPSRGEAIGGTGVNTHPRTSLDRDPLYAPVNAACCDKSMTLQDRAEAP
ncbi:hypothetical protein GCM10023257_73360 [Streptomyces hyderabadensis]|uniref:Uncharacterized protein n=1 Tax=Streptomyces hyderabadensis TaxID=598549 RepID=A0ABP9J0G6_9ACTN